MEHLPEVSVHKISHDSYLALQKSTSHTGTEETKFVIVNGTVSWYFFFYLWAFYIIHLLLATVSHPEIFSQTKANSRRFWPFHIAKDTIKSWLAIIDTARSNSTPVMTLPTHMTLLSQNSTVSKTLLSQNTMQHTVSIHGHVLYTDAYIHWRIQWRIHCHWHGPGPGNQCRQGHGQWTDMDRNRNTDTTMCLLRYSILGPNLYIAVLCLISWGKKGWSYLWNHIRRRSLVFIFMSALFTRIHTVQYTAEGNRWLNLIA